MKVSVQPLTEDRDVTLTSYIQEPSKDLENVQNRPAVLVFPGGAYLMTSDREAEPIALAYAAEGFQAFVLRYSVGERARGFRPLQEAELALSRIRGRADQWHVIPDQVAVCGFSAGGHLAGAVGLFGKERPDAMILSYPAVDLGDAANPLTAKNPLVQSLIGPDYTQADLDAYSLHKQVSSAAPPLFMWHTAGDRLVRLHHTLKLANAYADQGLDFEYHVFQEGVHGLSLAKDITANGMQGMVEPRCQSGLPMSVAWLRCQFGTPDASKEFPVVSEQAKEFLKEGI